MSRKIIIHIACVGVRIPSVIFIPNIGLIIGPLVAKTATLRRTCSAVVITTAVDIRVTHSVFYLI